MRSKRTRLAAVAAMTVMVVGLTATAAWAPKYLLGPLTMGPGSTCTVSDEKGTVTGDLNGAFNFLRFVGRGDDLYALGTVQGTCTLSEVGRELLADVPLSVTVVSAQCGSLRFALDKGTTGALTVDYNGPELQILWDNLSQSKSDLKQSCTAAKLLNKGKPGRAANALNALLEL